MRPAERTGFDAQMMQIALGVAARGLGRTAPNPSVGAVIADEHTGEVIARAWTAPGGRPHAETIAIAQAGVRARGATMYVTLEPCSHHGMTPPCADAIIEAGICARRVRHRGSRPARRRARAGAAAQRRPCGRAGPAGRGGALDCCRAHPARHGTPSVGDGQAGAGCRWIGAARHRRQAGLGDGAGGACRRGTSCGPAPMLFWSAAAR